MRGSPMCYLRPRGAVVVAAVLISLLSGGCVDTDTLVLDVADAAGMSILNSLLDALSAYLAGS